jgi:biotin carboxyl carrier protein
MADVIDAGTNDAVGVPSMPSPAVDPKAIRVRLAPASRAGDDVTVLVAPPSDPLRMTNPTVGIGPLGGAASPGAGEPEPEAPDPAAVRAQRQPLIDGVAMAVQLVVSGDGHGVLREADDAVTRLILEAGRAGEGGSVVREVLLEGFRFEVELEPERIAALRERATKGRAARARSGPLPVTSIIPGKVVQVSVAAGDEVTAGQQLLVVEAMKMQNELRSPRDGTIERVSVATGDNIEIGDLLVVIT